MMRRLRIAAAVAALALSAVAATAQSGRESFTMGLDAVQSARVADSLRDDLRDCAAIDPIYAIDCLRASTRAAARRLTNNAAYWEVEVALTRINRRLDQWIRVAGDEEADRLSHAGTRLRAVLPAALPTGRHYAGTLISEAIGNMLNATPEERPFFEPIADALSVFDGG